MTTAIAGIDADKLVKTAIERAVAGNMEKMIQQELEDQFYEVINRHFKEIGNNRTEWAKRINVSVREQVEAGITKELPKLVKDFMGDVGLYR